MPNDDKTIYIAGGDSAPASGLPATGGLPSTIGHFAISKRLGAGAMGEVFLGTDPAGHEVAIKVVSSRLVGEEGFLKRFQREIAILQALDHPHIARAIAHGMHDGRAWLAMEFVDGPSLADIQRAKGALHEDIVLRLAVQIAKGLDYVHEKAGLIHRDVKPANVLIGTAPGAKPDDPTGHIAKIIDFGLAKPVGTSDQALTMTGVVMGTPFYMSPEQIRGEKDIDLRTDIYALGASMFHLLTNTLPYEGSSPGIVMTGHLTAKIPDPGDRVPSLHKATRKIVMTAMAKAVKDRFLNWQGFIAACEKALSGIHERDHGTMRLLRKPLVLASTPTPPRVELPVLDEFQPAGRTQVAQREGPAPAEPTPGRGSRIRTTSGPVVTDDRQVATEALRKVRTERIKRVRADADAVRSGTAAFAKIAAPRPLAESAVYRKEPVPTPVWPLAMLLLSILALVLFLALH